MFLFPPRPEKPISRSLIRWYEKRGYVAQIKKNGTCSVALVAADSTVSFLKRTGEPHLAWEPTAEACDFFGHFPDSAFCFELLHSKGGGVRDTLYVFDVVRYLGGDLVGMTFEERMGLLRKVVPISSPRILYADLHHECLTGLFDSMVDDEGVALSPLDEGIVLKDPKAKLEPCRKADSNSGWQVKCRARTKNYSS